MPRGFSHMRKKTSTLLILVLVLFHIQTFSVSRNFGHNFLISFLGVLEVAFGLDRGDCDKKVDES